MSARVERLNSEVTVTETVTEDPALAKLLDSLGEAE